MATYPPDTLQSHDVDKLTSSTRDTLPRHMPGARPSRALRRALVCAAATLSVQPACHQRARAPSGAPGLGPLAP
jgi:hypothetical protein